MILACTCGNAYQDVKYGKGRRVMNPMKKDTDGAREYRCTVCQKQQFANTGTAKRKGK